MRANRERRAVERKRVYREALLSIPRLRNVLSCGVRDMSDGGIGLRLDVPLLPTEFNFSLDGFRTVHRCRLIWRDGAFAGAEFQPKLRKQPSP
jgi:hypothetical protein